MFDENFLNQLESGELRSAYKNEQGQWIANQAVKAQILELFRQGLIVPYPIGALTFFDKHTMLPRSFNGHEGVRIVPGGTSIRRGAHLASSVIVMPPAYVNVGSFIGQGTMVDSHVLVGSCAQIGERVHLSAGVQIGGVLEPIGERPVVIEDDVFVGADAVIVEGVVVRSQAVIAPGVVLSKSVPIYDLVNERQLPPGEIPACAVVVTGSRPCKSSWAQAQGLQQYAALIIKYRDEKTQTSLVLEEALRN